MRWPFRSHAGASAARDKMGTIGSSLTSGKIASDYIEGESYKTGIVSDDPWIRRRISAHYSLERQRSRSNIGLNRAVRDFPSFLVSSHDRVSGGRVARLGARGLRLRLLGGGPVRGPERRTDRGDAGVSGTRPQALSDVGRVGPGCRRASRPKVGEAGAPIEDGKTTPPCR